MTVFVHLFTRSVIQKVIIVTLNTIRQLNIIFSELWVKAITSATKTNVKFKKYVNDAIFEPIMFHPHFVSRLIIKRDN